MREADSRWPMEDEDSVLGMLGLFCNGEMRQQETNGKCLENTRQERRPGARIGGGVAQSILLSTRLV